jgi:hypothetical protein
MNRRLIGLLILLLVPFQTGAADGPANPLFEQMRTRGVVVTEAVKAPLPAPLMAGGLDAAGQQEILKKVVGNRFTVKEFAGKVGTAPHVYNIRKIPAPDADAPRVFALDVSFVAHGSLDRVADRDFLEGLHQKQKDRKVHILTDEEIRKRKLETDPDKRREERYSHGVFVVLDRVEVSAALHTVVTRHADSLLAATENDPRFAGDSEFPNQWRKITFDDEGRRQLGPARPYTGAGGYLKITHLHEPAGALFVECHMVYNEPKGWFSGADPLTTKLPAIIQSEVRTFRQELNRVKK